jgi:hypothetical protein
MANSCKPLPLGYKINMKWIRFVIITQLLPGTTAQTVKGRTLQEPRYILWKPYHCFVEQDVKGNKQMLDFKPIDFSCPTGRGEFW